MLAGVPFDWIGFNKNIDNTFLPQLDMGIYIQDTGCGCNCDRCRYSDLGDYQQEKQREGKQREGGIIMNQKEIKVITPFSMVLIGIMAAGAVVAVLPAVLRAGASTTSMIPGPGVYG